MTLADIFEQLTYGELSSLNMGGILDGEEISPNDYKRIIAFVNLGLTELYKRFWLSSKEIILELYSHITLYKLHNKYAISNTLSAEPYKYIIDSVYFPFQNDVLKIEQVFNECGEQVCINDLTKPCSVFTPYYDTLQIPVPENNIVLSVQYRASHPKIIYSAELDPSTVEVNLPEGLFEALLFYVAARTFSSLNSDQLAEGNNYIQKFEASCKKALELDLQISRSYSNLRLDQSGWV